MIELTPEQRQYLGGPEPARAVDPETRETYVLVREDAYNRMRAIVEEDGLDMRQVAILVDQAMREDDAHDPTLDSYQKYRNPS